MFRSFVVSFDLRKLQELLLSIGHSNYVKGKSYNFHLCSVSLLTVFVVKIDFFFAKKNGS